MQSVLLRLTGVSKSHWRGPHELRVLCEVSLEVPDGNVVSVWGTRGAGKSTLLKIAAGLQTPDQGSVSFRGEDLSKMSDGELTALRGQQIGLVRRAGPRSDLRVIDHVALPVMAEHSERSALRCAAGALDRVGLSGCAKQRWRSLSDGERALVSIAHAIVRRPALLLVDDPTTALDAVDRETVSGLLRSLADCEQIGVLITTPDMPAVMHSHEIRSLSGGRLLAPPQDTSTPGRLIEFPGGDGASGTGASSG